MEQNNLYQIEVNREQLLLIAYCIEDISRFAAGQPELHYTMDSLLSRQDGKGEIRDEIKEYLYTIKKIIHPELNCNASYGYDGGDQNDIIRKNLIGNTYQIYRQIFHFLAVDESWNNVYSGATLPSGNLGTISIKKILKNN